MRELKFRVWDKQKKEWFPIKNGLILVLNGEDTHLAFNTKSGPYRIPDTKEEGTGLNRWCVQQYTGLKDKNGREIYEGDILKHEFYLKNPTSIVRWSLEFEDHHPGWMIWSFTDQGGEMEVIGNIHENPELINASL